MSGLEKFQASEAWRTHFKKFLFMERKPVLLQQKETISESQRYSLDIGDDLKNILSEQKKNKKTVQFDLEKEISLNNHTSEDEQQSPTISSSEQVEGEQEMNRPVFSYDDTRYEGQGTQDLAMWQKTDESFEVCENTMSNLNSALFKHLQGDDDRKGSNIIVWQKTSSSDESFEALEKMCDKTASDPDSTLFQYLHSDRREQVLTEVKKRSANGNDVLYGNERGDDQRDSNIIASQNESFEALEIMCDKTASDPNSTLFQYLHSDQKEQVLTDFKKRSADGNIFHGRERDPLFIKLNNCTLLDDVEEPSRIWENTICCETLIQTSPVKMIGLLRPSTIIEEAPDDSANSNVSSQMSFQTATKEATSDVSSSVYDSAHDYTVASTRTDVSSHREQKLEVIDVDHMLCSAIAKANLLNATVPSIEINETEILNLMPASNENSNGNISSENELSMNLIDLEKTFGPLHCSPHSSILEITIADGKDAHGDDNCENKEPYELEERENDESIIEIISDDDDIEEVEANDEEQENNPVVKAKSEEISNISISINQDTFSFNESFEENKENVVQDSSNKSMQFNDTMEEVEYMLKKGMEYMAAEAAAKQIPAQAQQINNACEIKTAETQPNSPMTKKVPISHINASASKVKLFGYKTPAKKTPSIKKFNDSSSKKRFENDILKPFPKLDVFTKPLTHVRHKELASKQQKFSHIVSPIGTYMKKTATTPLMASMRIINKDSDLLNSTAFRELENESRLYHPKFEANSNTSETAGLSKLPGLSGVQRTLPKKAYISSELKHIVDERSPVTIPGGKKIQKYLENAMMPAVLRHNGKFKIPDGLKHQPNMSPSSSPAASTKVPLKSSNTNSIAGGRAKTSHIPRRNNASLADLSLMSGDVSMYTIMDAQKF